ncbi:MAG: GNAT family N-acetyltransferase [Bacteroidetes bacterium]|nr:MAG: GNAT family N-acetyltransferase [Bacteroidota bacterium]
MLQIIRTNASHPEFIQLVEKLDRYLAVTDGDDHAFYHQYNGILDIPHVVLAMEGEIAIGCGAIKAIDTDAMEVKRMFVEPDQRGKGIAGLILQELEKWTLELGKSKCLLETGLQQPEAIRLYEKSGYAKIPNYGQYAGVENSLCFEKRLT